MRVEYYGFAGIWGLTLEYGKALLSYFLQRKICVFEQCRETIWTIPSIHVSFYTFRPTATWCFSILIFRSFFFLMGVHRNMQMAAQMREIANVMSY